MNIPQPSRNFLGVNLDDVICVGDWDSGHFMLCTYVFDFNVVNCVFYLYSVLTDTICFIPFLQLSRTLEQCRGSDECTGSKVSLFGSLFGPI